MSKYGTLYLNFTQVDAMNRLIKQKFGLISSASETLVVSVPVKSQFQPS